MTTVAEPILRTDNDFRKLWVGQTASLIGAQVAAFAIPVVAVVTLGADEFEMGVLATVNRLPYLLFLFAGVWADRFSRRRTMIGAGLVRAVCVAAVPVLYMLDALSLPALLTVVFTIGVLSVFYDVANLSHLPTLVPRERLGEANARMQLSMSVSQLVGPALGGLAVGGIAAALLLGADTAGLLVAVVAIALIRRPEPEPQPAATRPRVFAAIGEGLRWAWRQPLIRPGLIAIGLYMVAFFAVLTLLMLYVLRDLRLAPGWAAVMLAAGGVGAMVGATVAVRVMKRIGVGPAFIAGALLGVAGLALVPLAAGPLWMVVALLALGQFVYGIGSQIAIVNHTTLRMALTPDALQGRINATYRAVQFGVGPLGGIAGGVLGTVFGARATIAGCVVAMLIPAAVLIFSPVPHQREIPHE
jgi:MFS family permease